MSHTSVVGKLPVVDWKEDADLGTGADLLHTLEDSRQRSWGAQSARGLEIFAYDEAASVLRSRDFVTPFGRLSTNSGLTPEDGWIYFHMERMLAGVQGPEHIKLKGIFLEFFGPRAVGRWKEDIQELVLKLTRDAAVDNKIDIAKEVCLVLPAYLFCRLINRPDEDALFLAKTSDEILTIFEQNPLNRDTILRAGRAMKDYADRLLRERESNLGDDLVSYLIVKRNEGALTDEELTHNVAMLLEASVDNTGNQFALTMHHLLSVPGRWQEVARDRSLIQTAISESIRLTPKVATVNRIARVDTEVNNVSVAEGSWVSVSIIAAHRDPTGMPDVLNFDMHRIKPRQPLVFGGGMYMCLGMFLSLLELEEGIATLVQAFPHMKLNGDISWNLTSRNITVQALPVSL
jgi:cytochrome P450